MAKPKTRDRASGALQGAATGAALGTAVGGPLGTAVGAVGGGLMGALTAKGQDEAAVWNPVNPDPTAQNFLRDYALAMHTFRRWARVPCVYSCFL
jgi:phage tail tape-measure protein